MATLRQKVLRTLYPALMKMAQWTGKNAVVLHNRENKVFQTPIYNLSIAMNNGKMASLQEWQGKKLLVVNTASDCGYTPQYGELQQLQERYRETLQVIGFPANDFKDQETKNDAAIAQFCQVNFGVTFPLAKRSSVVKGTQQHPVFQWLTQRDKNGWNEKAPSWNFSKYLINETGVLTHYFDPSVPPLSKTVAEAIEA